MRSYRIVTPLALVALALLLVVPSTTVAKPRTKLQSKDTFGTQADAPSTAPAVSRTGRFVAFESEAPLIARDTNDVADVYLRDNRRRRTKRVSVGSGGEQGLARSGSPSISADGRFVAFESAADNLVPDDGNGFTDVFVRDRKRGRTRRVSVRTDRSEVAGNSTSPSISANGRFVAFRSTAPDLVDRDTNEVADIFVHDRWKKRTRRVSVRSNRKQAKDASAFPVISANGRYIAFDSKAGNLVSKDTNGAFDVFVHDRRRRRTRRVSVSSKGKQANDASRRPAISANGRFVSFDSNAGNLTQTWSGYRDIYVRDRRLGVTSLVSRKRNGSFANGASLNGSISDDGRTVLFSSAASRLVRDDRNGVVDIFVKDRRSGTVRLVSRSSGGTVGDMASDSATREALSGNGRFVAYRSWATNLIPVDRNDTLDVFRRGPLR